MARGDHFSEAVAQPLIRRETASASRRWLGVDLGSGMLRAGCSLPGLPVWATT